MKSMLGEMINEAEEGYLIDGRCSIATQEAWLVSGTLRENITYQ